MNPYSHLIIASQLEGETKPTNPAEYYWGAIAPDVRYIAGVPRSQTHLEPEAMLEFLAKYPHIKPFIQGYLVHCLTDLIELKTLLRRNLIIHLIRSRVSHHILAVMVEAFFIEQSLVRKQVQGEPNEIFRDLGIPDEKTAEFGKLMNRFLANPSFEAEIEFVRAFGANLRLEKYISAMKNLQKYAFLKPVFFRLIDMDGLNRKVLAEIRQAEAFRQICG